MNGLLVAPKARATGENHQAQVALLLETTLVNHFLGKKRKIKVNTLKFDKKTTPTYHVREVVLEIVENLFLCQSAAVALVASEAARLFGVNDSVVALQLQLGDHHQVTDLALLRHRHTIDGVRLIA